MPIKHIHAYITFIFFQRPNMILLITPLRTIVVSCTEASSEFSDVPLDDSKVNILWFALKCKHAVASRYPLFYYLPYMDIQMSEIGKKIYVYLI